MAKRRHSTEYTSKRLKVAHANNPFIDSEAQVDGDEYEDEESNEPPQTRSTKDAFLKDDFLADFDDDELLHASLAHRFEDVPPVEEEWEGSLIERAHRRAHEERPKYVWFNDNPEVNEPPPFSFLPGDKLWEITCAVGSEESIIHSLFQADPLNLLSAFSTPRSPGRVYLEMKLEEDVISLIRGSNKIRLRNARLVQREDMIKVLTIQQGFDHVASSWVRMRGNTTVTARYINDLAYLQDCFSHFILWVLPRYGLFDNATRPPQAVASFWSSDLAEMTINAAPEGVTVDKKGYWGIRSKDRRLYRHDCGMPTMNELELFKNCAAVPSDLLKATRHRIGSLHFQLGDRVKVEVGTFQGLTGKVIEKVEPGFMVYIPSHDMEDYFCPEELRKEFRVGDWVSTEFLTESKLGWIIGIDTNGAYETRRACLLEYGTLDDLQDIPLDFLKFDEEPFSIVPRLFWLNRPRHTDLGWHRFENKWYVGKTVQVVGQHRYKGVKGTIKYAFPNGQCQVYLDIFNHFKLEDIKLSNIRIITNQTVTEHIGEFSQSTRSTTPIPELQDSYDSAAWDPLAQEPGSMPSQVDNSSADLVRQRREEMQWILHPSIAPNLQQLRITLQSLDPSMPPGLTPIRLEDGEVVVRRGMWQTLKAPLECWRATRPGLQSLCVCIAGEHIGKRFKVAKREGDQAFLRPEGQKAARHEILIPVPLTSLVGCF